MRNPEVAGSKVRSTRIPPPALQKTYTPPLLTGASANDTAPQYDQLLQLPERDYDNPVRRDSRDNLHLRIRSAKKTEDPELARDLLDSGPVFQFQGQSPQPGRLCSRVCYPNLLAHADLREPLD